MFGEFHVTDAIIARERFITGDLIIDDITERIIARASDI